MSFLSFKSKDIGIDLGTANILIYVKGEGIVLKDQEILPGITDSYKLKSSFDTIVASGENSSKPHATPTDRKIQEIDIITIDMGCKVNGYCSDMTRTVAIGSVNEKQKFVYDTVLKAQLESLEKIKAGAICKDIDNVARNIINLNGFEGCFGHGLGHSVGIEIHESPNFSSKSINLLSPSTKPFSNPTFSPSSRPLVSAVLTALL